MARKEYTVVHKKSNVVNSGVPKLPSASTLEYGEIAVNYGVSGETLSIRNSSDQIATFPSRGIIEGMISSEGEKYLTTATTIPTESTISSSGFTKNGVTGINVNGTATTITNGVADITIPSGLPAVTASDNGKVLTVVNGAWTAVTPTVVYTGNGTPDNSLGNNGDLYLQTNE